MRNTHLTVLVVMLMALGLGACEREGPAERGGEQMDESTERAGEAMEEAGDEAEDEVEDMTR